MFRRPIRVRFGPQGAVQRSGKSKGAGKEAGIDDGGLTNEMYAKFFDQLLLLRPDLFASTGAICARARCRRRMRRGPRGRTPRVSRRTSSASGASCVERSSTGGRSRTRWRRRSCCGSSKASSRPRSTRAAPWCVGRSRRPRSSKNYSSWTRTMLRASAKYIWVKTTVRNVFTVGTRRCAGQRTVRSAADARRQDSGDALERRAGRPHISVRAPRPAPRSSSRAARRWRRCGGASGRWKWSRS